MKSFPLEERFVPMQHHQRQDLGFVAALEEGHGIHGRILCARGGQIGGAADCRGQDRANARRKRDYGEPGPTLMMLARGCDRSTFTRPSVTASPTLPAMSIASTLT